MRKEPGFIALCVTFGVIFVVLITCIIVNTVHTVKTLDMEDPVSSVGEHTEISTEWENQGGIGGFSGTEAVEEIEQDRNREGETDPPEDIEYIQEDLPRSERERLEQGILFEPMDDE